MKVVSSRDRHKRQRKSKRYGRWSKDMCFQRLRLICFIKRCKQRRRLKCCHLRRIFLHNIPYSKYTARRSIYMYKKSFSTRYKLLHISQLIKINFGTIRHHCGRKYRPIMSNKGCVLLYQNCTSYHKYI